MGWSEKHMIIESVNNLDFGHDVSDAPTFDEYRSEDAVELGQVCF